MIKEVNTCLMHSSSTLKSVGSCRDTLCTIGLSKMEWQNEPIALWQIISLVCSQNHVYQLHFGGSACLHMYMYMSRIAFPQPHCAKQHHISSGSSLNQMFHTSESGAALHMCLCERTGRKDLKHIVKNVFLLAILLAAKAGNSTTQPQNRS